MATISPAGLEAKVERELGPDADAVAAVVLSGLHQAATDPDKGATISQIRRTLMMRGERGSAGQIRHALLKLMAEGKIEASDEPAYYRRLGR